MRLKVENDLVVKEMEWTILPILTASASPDLDILSFETTSSTQASARPCQRHTAQADLQGSPISRHMSEACPKIGNLPFAWIPQLEILVF